jgi:hypothetical protein
MFSRRALLRAGGLGLTAALGGCLFGGGSDTDGDGDQTPDRTTPRSTAEPDPVQRLQTVDPVTVPDDARFVCTAHAVVEFVSGDAG